MVKRKKKTYIYIHSGTDLLARVLVRCAGLISRRDLSDKDLMK